MENGLALTIVNDEHFLHLTWPHLVQSSSLPLDLKTSGVAPTPVPLGLLPNLAPPHSSPAPGLLGSPPQGLCTCAPLSLDGPLPDSIHRAPPRDPPPSRGHCALLHSLPWALCIKSPPGPVLSASNPAWGISVAFIVTSHTCGFSLALFSPRRMCTLGR